jgi:large subunit ribosomal protein L16
MFIPKQQKFQKQQKGRSFKKINSFFNLDSLKFGSIALISLEFGKISSKQLNAVYQSINKIIKKNGRIVMRTFAHTPVSKKPVEVRMGKGKGSVDSWVSKIKVGSIICEIESSNKSLALLALKSAQYRLSIQTKII